MAKKKKPKKNKRLNPYIHPIQSAAFESDALAKDFLRSPKTFAKKLGFPLEELACPPEAHAALKRGEAFAKEVKARKIELDPDSIRELQKLAREQFGRNFEVSFIPFGLQFRERMRIDPGSGITATGTASVTWLDSDADVDG